MIPPDHDPLSPTIRARVNAVDDAIALALAKMDPAAHADWLRAEVLQHVDQFGWQVEALTADLATETDVEALVEMLALFMKAEAADLTGVVRVRVTEPMTDAGSEGGSVSGAPAD